ncbi:MAG: hypothetical protein BWZ10_00727 [candidate division BRC1 bacterium ADurb.BinA364]|nr:MAG: hypothetical protein BWZ10_00727 [candidate division BRC1 bacterium ADurb.BinA364]
MPAARAPELAQAPRPGAKARPRVEWRPPEPAPRAISAPRSGFAPRASDRQWKHCARARAAFRPPQPPRRRIAEWRPWCARRFRRFRWDRARCRLRRIPAQPCNFPRRPVAWPAIAIARLRIDTNYSGFSRNRFRIRRGALPNRPGRGRAPRRATAIRGPLPGCRPAARRPIVGRCAEWRRRPASVPEPGPRWTRRHRPLPQRLARERPGPAPHWPRQADRRRLKTGQRRARPAPTPPTPRRVERDASQDSACRIPPNKNCSLGWAGARYTKAATNPRMSRPAGGTCASASSPPHFLKPSPRRLYGPARTAARFSRAAIWPILP